MKPALDPSLNTVFAGLFVASIGGCFSCCLCALYGGVWLSSAQKGLLQRLKQLAPPVHERLHDPFWRNRISPWHLSAFLKSEELDDVPGIHEGKEKCRRALRWQTRGMMGFMIAWAFGFAVGALAVAVGSTSIRFNG